MSKLTDFDINELVLQLHSELKIAFEVANSAEQQKGLQLETVNARIGRKKDNEEDNNGNESNFELLNAERYPAEEDWEIEVTYKHGDPLPDIPQSQNWITSSESQLVFKRLGNTQLMHIKGISLVWEKRLNKEGLFTIEDLALASSIKISEICNLYNSIAPIEFQTKVLLIIRDFTPIVFPKFKNIPLSALLLKTRNDLKKLFEHKLSGPEISNLKTMAAIIYLVFDKSFADKLRLELLTK